MPAAKPALTGVVVCTQAHDAKGWGEVPEGSLWDASHAVVKAKPAAFASVKGVVADEAEGE